MDGPMDGSMEGFGEGAPKGEKDGACVGIREGFTEGKHSSGSRSEVFFDLLVTLHRSFLLLFVFLFSPACSRSCRSRAAAPRATTAGSALTPVSIEVHKRHNNQRFTICFVVVAAD